MDRRVADAMKPFFEGNYGNPSSLHWIGREAHEALDAARQKVADLLHAKPNEIYFTASGTEADNLALIGLSQSLGIIRTRIVTGMTEHPAILETCRYLEKCGAEVVYLPVNQDGIIEPAALKKAIRPKASIVSIMMANNVVGTIQPVEELARIAHEHGALFHTDAVQAAGKIPIDVQKQKIDLLSLSGHKFHGPKGVGALYVRDGIKLSPIIFGGGQEHGLRSATENLAGIAGLACAAELAVSDMADETVRLIRLRDKIVESISRTIPNAYLIGHPYHRLPGHLCLGFAGLEGEAIKLLLILDELGFAVSSGSACSSNHAGEPSHVLLAMGFDPARARGSLRVTLGRFNTEPEVDRFLSVLPDAVGKLKPTMTTFQSESNFERGAL